MGVSGKSILEVPGVTLAVAAVGVIASFFITESTILSHAAALACIILISLSLYYINNNCFLVSPNSSLLPSIFLLMVFANPSSIAFSRYHIVGLIMIWSVFFGVKYLSDEKEKIGMLFFSVLLASISAIVLPPMAWVFAALFVINFFLRPVGFVKYLLTCVSAAILPFIYIFSYRYMFSQMDLVPYFQNYWNTISDVEFSFAGMDIIRIFCYLMIVAMFFRSLSFAAFTITNKKRESKKLILYSYLYTVIITFLIVMYHEPGRSSSVILLSLPFSILFFDFLTNNGRKNESSAFLLLLIVVSVLYWLSFVRNIL